MTSSSNDSQMPAKTSYAPIRLEVRGITIPAFKNRKRAILDARTGKRRTLTEPRVKELMERITTAIEWQLCCAIPIIAGEILTVPQVLSWIASYLPSDDSRQNIPQLLIEAVDCDKGEEGAMIVIEKL